MCGRIVRAVVLIGAMVASLTGNPAARADDLGPKDSWVHFTSFSYSGTDPDFARISSPEKQYLNPILAGFYPDPSICRVGDDYYLVNSSFSYFPGVPIFHSRDLINWTQIGDVLNRASDFETLRPGDVSRGIYAPAIRYHDGTFYMVTTLVNGGGNFYVTARDPAGPWSEPHWLKSVDGIDPSFFFDDDGKAYIAHCGPAPDGKSLYQGHRTIRVQEVNLQSADVTGEEKILVNGGTDISKHPVWIEGPHLFKRDGKYYLIAAEGGTGFNHSEVVFRSDSVWGPYIPFAGNPILTQRDLPPDRPDPVTCTGHADFVESSSGEWWAVFLGCRPYERNFYNTGRETFLLPVEWKNDWPIILAKGQTVPRILDRPKLPVTASSPTTGSFNWIDDFKSSQLNLRWNFLRVPKQEWYGLTAGGLQIAPRPETLTSFQNPSFIACREQHADFSASTTISINPQTTTCDTGLVAFQNETHYFFLGVRIQDGTAREVFLEQVSGGKPADPSSTILASAPLPPECDRIELKIQAQGRPYSFFYRTGNKNFVAMKEQVDGSILSTDIAGGFQGVMLGMYARSR
jgi:alpha-N-arabinofuranosidase